MKVYVFPRNGSQCGLPKGERPKEKQGHSRKFSAGLAAGRRARLVHSHLHLMDDEIEGYNADLERQIATLKDGLVKYNSAKQESSRSIVRFEALSVLMD